MRRGRSRVAIGSGARGIPYQARMAKRLRCGPVIYARYGGDGVVASPRVPGAMWRAALLRRTGTHLCFVKCGSRFCSAPFAALMLRCARDTIPASVATPLPDPPPQGGREKEAARASHPQSLLRKPIRAALLDRALEGGACVHARKPRAEI